MRDDVHCKEVAAKSVKIYNALSCDGDASVLSAALHSESESDDRV